MTAEEAIKDVEEIEEVEVEGEGEVDVDEITTVKFLPPKSHEKGYLKRVRKAMTFSDRLTDKENPPKLADLDEFIEFILKWVKEPVDRQEAFDAVEDLSQDEYNSLLQALFGAEAEENEVKKANAGKSD